MNLKNQFTRSHGTLLYKGREVYTDGNILKGCFAAIIDTAKDVCILALPSYMEGEAIEDLSNNNDVLNVEILYLNF